MIVPNHHSATTLFHVASTAWLRLPSFLYSCSWRRVKKPSGVTVLGLFYCHMLSLAIPSCLVWTHTPKPTHTHAPAHTKGISEAYEAYVSEQSSLSTEKERAWQQSRTLQQLAAIFALSLSLSLSLSVCVCVQCCLRRGAVTEYKKIKEEDPFRKKRSWESFGFRRKI